MRAKPPSADGNTRPFRPQSRVQASTILRLSYCPGEKCARRFFCQQASVDSVHCGRAGAAGCRAYGTYLRC
jgi:hypothetical protein